jgi:3-hydroxybutyryl-CoA dehydratase
VRFEDIKPGLQVRTIRRVTTDEIDAFATFSGDTNPLHMQAGAAQLRGYRDRVAHGLLLGAWTSALIGTKLPGEGALITDISFQFRAPVHPGDEMALTGTVRHVSPALGHITVDIDASVNGSTVATGRAGVLVK